MLAGWRDGARLDIADEMLRVTMLIVAKALFSADVAEDVQRVARAVETMQEFMGQRSLLPPWVPTPRELRARRAVRDLDEVVYRLIRERRASGDDRGDLLSMLLLARDEDGNGMTDAQARDEVVTLLAAGHETTANTLNWTFYLLAQHPNVAAKLHAELDAVLAGRAPALADLAQLPYTEMVVKEAMRLYPAAWAVSREATEDVQLREVVIPKGSVAGLMLYSAHHDARWFPEPEKFDPERFSPEREHTIPRYAYLPFGAGPRVCIGNSFALMEARLLLATIAQRYTLALAPGQTVQTLARITLIPKGGLPMTMHERRRPAPNARREMGAYALAR
jgi:cytochrome P450